MVGRDRGIEKAEVTIVKSRWVVYECRSFYSFKFSVCLIFLNNKLGTISTLKTRFMGKNFKNTVAIAGISTMGGQYKISGPFFHVISHRTKSSSRDWRGCREGEQTEKGCSRLRNKHLGC